MIRGGLGATGGRHAVLPFIAAAIAFALLALGAGAPAAEAKRTPQLRGAMLTPNWENPPPNGATPAELGHEVRAACALGSDVVRLVVSWPRLEPSRGHFDPAYAATIDHVLATAQGCGAGVVFTLVWTPCWASSGAPCWPSPPRRVASYARATRRVLERWGEQLLAFEVWNEPNEPHFWRGSARRYVALVHASERAASDADGDVQILAGALAGPDAPYLRRLYRLGLRGHDAISIHPYNLRTTSPGSGFADPTLSGAAAGDGSRAFGVGVPLIRRVMRRNDEKEKRIWLTEFGFAACPATPYCVPEATQAEWIAKSLALAADWRYVRAAIVFSLRDVGPTAQYDHRFGLMRRDFSARPSYAAMQSTLAALP